MSLHNPLRNARHALGITQRELALRADLSLATVQSIEAGRANPSVSTLTRIGVQLGLRLVIEPVPPDWQRLAELGAPISGASGSPAPPSAAELCAEITRAIQQIELATEVVSARQKDALAALVLAIAHGYPSFFRSSFAGASSVTQLIPDHVPGRLIKLKRIAERRLAVYL